MTDTTKTSDEVGNTQQGTFYCEICCGYWDGKQVQDGKCPHNHPVRRISNKRKSELWPRDSGLSCQHYQ